MDPDQLALIWLFWTRIRIGIADPDQGARKLTKINLISILSQRLLFLRRYVLLTYHYINYLFHVNIL